MGLETIGCKSLMRLTNNLPTQGGGGWRVFISGGG